jgi:hypothetical protein
MSSQSTCGNCRHWDAGLCLRFPPVIVPPGPYSSHYPSLAFVFPETVEDMTCGEWRPKEPGATFTYTASTPDGPVDVTTNGSGFLELIERRAE